ncbi:hypothetical protein ACFFX1_14170 [Dactylosporangium sucinum]|uniref:hypothetical protein n=1 Tax=Dactylosporangium sucinum TaxID=1424081 RepID=UPI00167EFE50|nr:hypothetical protein [Dactylosporangium sucinum]
MTRPRPLPALRTAAVPAPTPRPSRVNDTPEALGSRANVLDPGRWSSRWGGLPALPVARPPEPSPPVDAPVAAAPARPAPAPPPPAAPPEGAPRWLDAAGWGAEDRARLRRTLQHRYDAYARVVTRTLAEEPGLRAAGGGADLITDLVALCAYMHERDAVNDALRGAAGRPDGAESLIARGATSGLRRLPAVIGPVFAAGQAAVGAGYRAGDELVEPAFVDVWLTGATGTGAAVEYVIWSVSARRVDRFLPQEQPGAAFPPGSRFAVLAVDEPAADGPLRVLLRDRTGERPDAAGRWDETLRRLRHSTTVAAEHPGTLGFPIGLDQWGRPFIPDPFRPTTGGW